VNEHRYFAKDSPDDFERERLKLLTQIADPSTTGRITSLGIGPGWRCLEVGAGDGSVARWMAGRVGPKGHVVAADLNTRFLRDHNLPNLEVRRLNILEDELETAHYDLAHCRCLLQHLTDPLLGLKRLYAAVRPGGWLFVEEADSRTFGASDPNHPRAAEYTRSSRAMITDLMTTGLMHASLGRRLPSLVDGLGVEELGYDGIALIGRGGNPTAQFFQMTDELLRGRIVASGALTESDFDERVQAYSDSSFWMVGLTMFGAWGRRPR
jgi:SAM-dependent methyltransferase